MRPADDPQVLAAMEGLVEYAGARRYELTELEVNMWLRFVQSVDPQKFLRFLGVWGIREKFMPNVSDAARALGLVATPEQEFEELLRQVKVTGPYRTPNIGASLSQAVVLMGGWAKVCEDVPDASQEFAFNSFRKRFLELYAQAQSQVEVQGIQPPKVLGLADASRERLALAYAQRQLPAPAAEEPPGPRP